MRQTRILWPLSTLLQLLILAAILATGCAPIQPTSTEPAAAVALAWRGKPLDGAADDCGYLSLSADGTARVGHCDNQTAITAPLNAAHQQEWLEMQRRFAPFQIAIGTDRIEFHGSGASSSTAWHQAIATWAQLIHAELIHDQVSAAGATVLNWQIGVVPDQPERCRWLLVQAYGYAYAHTEPCVGGPVHEIRGGWLSDGAMTVLEQWRQQLAPLNVEYTYFAGEGETAASPVAQQALLAWVVTTYHELMGGVSATGPTAMRWSVGRAPGSADSCQQLTVLRYGYAYAQIVPCAGGPTQQETQGLLTETELDPFFDWLSRFAPLYVDDEYGTTNYLDGYGSREAVPATIAEMTLWAQQIYARLNHAAAEERAPTVAFVRDGVLYLQSNAPHGALTPVDSCDREHCQIQHLQWSPDGAHLLYYWMSLDDARATELRLADHAGQVRTIAKEIAFYRPAAWSPGGDQIVYLGHTDRMSTTGPGNFRIFEVWTVAVNGDRSVTAPELRGELGFGDGCGGGGRSPSATVYEGEGGFAYGYLAAIVAWTPADILLYSNNCGSRGVGRFDLATGTELPAYAGGLRSLSLAADGQRWVAIDETNQIVVGEPASLTYRPLLQPTDSGMLPELVFWGASENIYFTTVPKVGESVELIDEMHQLGLELPVDPFFDFTQPALYMLEPETNRATITPTLLWQGDDYAYARVVEQFDGSLLFAQVESNRALYQAIQLGTATDATVGELLPTVAVMHLQWPMAGTKATPELWLANARQFALAPDGRDE